MPLAISAKLEKRHHGFQPPMSQPTWELPGGKDLPPAPGGFDGKTTPKFSDSAEYARLFFCHPVETLPPLEFRFDQGSVYRAESADFIQKKAKDNVEEEHQAVQIERPFPS